MIVHNVEQQQEEETPEQKDVEELAIEEGLGMGEEMDIYFSYEWWVRNK